MKITLSGEYDKTIYWLNRLNWFCVFMMLAFLVKNAIHNEPYLGLLAYMGMAANICSISLNRQWFLENEMFRLGRLLINENGGYNGNRN